MFNYIYVFQIQCALLYTTVYGQRRIRVTTLSLPCTSMLSNLFRAADLDTQFSCYMKQGIQICYFSLVLSTFVASVMHVFPICVDCFPELNPVLKVVNWFMSYLQHHFSSATSDRLKCRCRSSLCPSFHSLAAYCQTKQ